MSFTSWQTLFYATKIWYIHININSSSCFAVLILTNDFRNCLMLWQWSLLNISISLNNKHCIIKLQSSKPSVFYKQPNFSTNYFNRLTPFSRHRPTGLPLLVRDDQCNPQCFIYWQTKNKIIDASTFYMFVCNAIYLRPWLIMEMV